jgi:hypothetical protein
MSQRRPDDEKAEGAAKDKFRAALERKRAHQHPHEQAGQGGPKVGTEHGAAGGKRTFRRKSG